MAFLNFFSNKLLLFVNSGFFSVCSGRRGRGSFGEILVLVSSVALRGVPSKLIINMTFKSVTCKLSNTAVISTYLLTLNVKLRGFPSNATISIPLEESNFSENGSFFLKRLDNVMSPVSKMLKTLLILGVEALLPFLLTFTTNTVVCIIISSVIPSDRAGGEGSLVTLFALVNFSVVVVLSVSLKWRALYLFFFVRGG